MLYKTKNKRASFALLANKTWTSCLQIRIRSYHIKATNQIATKSDSIHTARRVVTRLTNHVKDDPLPVSRIYTNSNLIIQCV